MSRMPIVLFEPFADRRAFEKACIVLICRCRGVGRRIRIYSKQMALLTLGALIVDAGCDEPETREAFDFALRELGISWDSVDVFITHFHWDHCAGLSANLESWHEGAWRH